MYQEQQVTGVQRVPRLRRLDNDNDSSVETTLLLGESVVTTRSSSGRGCSRNNHVLARLIIVLCQYCIIGSMFFCVEMIGGLQATIIRVTGINSTKYNILFSGYAWPDIIMSIVGGLVIDRIVGMRAGYVIFLGIAMLGQGVLAVGGYFGEFFIMLGGRLLFGCGIGSAQSVVTGSQVLLFDKRTTTIVIAINGAFLRLSAGIALFSSQRIYDWFDFLPKSRYKLGATLLVGFLLMGGAFLCGLTIALIDFYKVDKLKKQRVDNDAEGDIDRPFSVTSCCYSMFGNFRFAFWLVIIIGALFYPVVFLLVANGQLFFISKYSADLHEASLINSLNYAAAIFLSPFIGLVIGFIKRHCVWTMVGALFGLTSHLIFSIGSNYIFLAYIAAILTSVSYSFTMLSLYTLIGCLVSPSQLTTAYGIQLSLYDIFYCVLSLMQGILIDKFGYFFYELINLTLVSITILVIVLLLIDQASSSIKNKINVPVPRLVTYENVNTGIN